VIFFRSTPSRTLAAAAAASIVCAALLTGCGIDTVDHSISGTSALQGTVHGGQQPVSGAVIQLYAVGSAGNGSSATPMLAGAPLLTGADGTFNLTNRYTCGKSSLGTTIVSPSNQVYIVATLGNPGLSPAVTNAKLAMMTALGDCASLPSASYVEINEVTTAAAAWALAPFITVSPVAGVTATNVGASSTNVSGITNAFLDAALLADSSTGLPADLTAKPNLTVETPKLISLANAIASCVNSDGTTGCAPLVAAATPTGSLVPPVDTLAAALNIVKNPGENVEAVFQAGSDRPPFGGGLSTFPNDWTMSLTVTGGGMDSPTAMAIDSQSNVWVVSHNSPVSVFGAQGQLLSGTGYGSGIVYKSNGIAIDINDDVWVTDYNNTGNSSGPVLKILGLKSGAAGTIVQSGGSPGFYTDIIYPFAVSADTNGNMFVDNIGGNGTVTVLNSDGSIYVNSDQVSGGMLGGEHSAFANDIAVDANHGYWIPDGNRGVIHVTADGVSRTTDNCCYSSFGVATDAYGSLWVTNLLNGSISEVAEDGSKTLTEVTGGGLDYPMYIAVDAAQNLWISNDTRSFVEFAGNANALLAGQPISPSTGAHDDGGYGLDSGLSEPNYIAPDRSGNLWLADQVNNSVVMFFGLATPTVTPIQPIPSAP
jgi:hypothetical protein